MMTPPRPWLRDARRLPLTSMVIMTLAVGAGMAGCAGEHRRHAHQPPPMQPLPPQVEPQSQQWAPHTRAHVSPHLLPYHGRSKTRDLIKGNGMWILNQPPRDRPPRGHGIDTAARGDA